MNFLLFFASFSIFFALKLFIFGGLEYYFRHVFICGGQVASRRKLVIFGGYLLAADNRLFSADGL
jgi:hypothetical protein